jgi:transmembrane protein DUF3566
MTETQAKSGTASAGSAQAGADQPADAAGMGAAGSDSGAPEGGSDANVVGRAAVPGETNSGGGPKYMRAPGMVPPPDSLTVPIQSPVATATGKASVIAPLSSPPSSGPPAGSAPAGGGPVAAGSASVSARASVRPTPTSENATQAIGLPSGAAPGVSGSARVTDAVRAARKTVSAAVGRGPRRARLHLKRIDPWSVMKFAFAVSFVLFVVVIVATSVLYLALDAMDVFASVNKMLADLVSSTGGEKNDTFKITAKGVIGGAALLGLVNVVLFTALATLGSFIYNVCADLVGGIELTLAEKD